MTGKSSASRAFFTQCDRSGIFCVARCRIYRNFYKLPMGSPHLCQFSSGAPQPHLNPSPFWDPRRLWRNATGYSACNSGANPRHFCIYAGIASYMAGANNTLSPNFSHPGFRGIGTMRFQAIGCWFVYIPADSILISLLVGI